MLPTRAARALVLGTMLVVLAMLPTAASAQDDGSGGQPAGPEVAGQLSPKASILVDAETGDVLSSHNPREPIGVASTAKLLSALVASEELDDNALVPVSAKAAGMPALKLSLKQGERWRAVHLLHAMLLCSCNDASVALAEGAGGSLDGFAELMDKTADRLGMRDRPRLQDPAGLDDEFSVGGGNLLSARDLAIAARAFLADEQLARIVTMPEYRFDGGDGEPHSVKNHNRILTTYPGAIGMKTGYTRKSGYSLVAAARREGRTLIAIVIGSPNMYAQASALLDQGFSSSDSSGEGGADDQLPAVPDVDELSNTVTPTSSLISPGDVPDSSSDASSDSSSDASAEADGGLGLGQRVLIVLALMVIAVVARRRQVVRRRQRRRLAAHRARLARQEAEFRAPGPTLAERRTLARREVAPG